MEYKPPTSAAGDGDFLKTTVGPDAVTFDILMIHIPHQEKALLDQLWQETDEQVLPPEIRTRLIGNGFRTGIIGASIPEPLSKLMAIKGRGLRKSLEEEVSLKKEHAAPLTLSKIQTLQPGNINVIPTLDQPVDRIPVFSDEGGFFSAETYYDATTSLSVAVKPISDGSVEFELTPFLTFGQAQPITRYRYGQLIRTTDQPTKTFDQLRCHLPLRPGQFLVIGPSHRNTSGLGHYFFTQGIGDFDQKIIVIRLLFTQHDRLFHQFPGFQEIYDNDFKDENRAGTDADQTSEADFDPDPDSEKESENEKEEKSKKGFPLWGGWSKKGVESFENE